MSSSSSSTLKPLLKPGVTDLVLTSEGRLSVRTFGRWTSGVKSEFKELFLLVLEQVEPKALERFKAGEAQLVKVISPDQSPRLRAIVYESTNVFRDRVIEISLRVLPARIPAAGADFPHRFVDTICGVERGLFLVAGGAGQGKSTLAAILVEEYLKRSRARAIVINDPLEYYFREEVPVTYRAAEVSAAEIDRALALCPSLIVAEKAVTSEARNRLAQAATTQLVITSVQAQDSLSAIQSWLAGEGTSSDLFAHTLAGVVTVKLDTEGARFKPCYQTTLVVDQQGEVDGALRALIAQRDWLRLRHRLQDDKALSSGRLVA